jgi:ribosomal protein L28
MAARCDLCGKGTAFGQNIRHSSTGRWQRKAHRTKRFFKPNLQEHTIWRDGHKVTMTLCTRCLRTSLRVSGAPVRGSVSNTAPRPS